MTAVNNNPITNVKLPAVPPPKLSPTDANTTNWAMTLFKFIADTTSVLRHNAVKTFKETSATHQVIVVAVIGAIVFCYFFFGARSAKPNTTENKDNKKSIDDKKTIKHKTKSININNTKNINTSNVNVNVNDKKTIENKTDGKKTDETKSINASNVNTTKEEITKKFYIDLNKRFTLINQQINKIRKKQQKDPVITAAKVIAALQDKLPFSVKSSNDSETAYLKQINTELTDLAKNAKTDVEAYQKAKEDIDEVQKSTKKNSTSQKSKQKETEPKEETISVKSVTNQLEMKGLTETQTNLESSYTETFNKLINKFKSLINTVKQKAEAKTE